MIDTPSLTMILQRNFLVLSSGRLVILHTSKKPDSTAFSRQLYELGFGTFGHEP